MKNLAAILLFAVLLIALGQQVKADYPPITPGLYDDNAPLIFYSGSGWTNGTNASAYGGRFWGSQANNTAIDFVVDGRAVIIYYPLCSACAQMYVCLNTFQCTTINTFSSSTLWYASTTFLLGSDPTSVRITKNGTDTNWLYLDALYVQARQAALNVPTQVVTINITQAPLQLTLPPEPTPAWRDEYLLDDRLGNERPVAFEYKMDAGQIFIGAGIVGLIVIGLIRIAYDFSRR